MGRSLGLLAPMEFATKTLGFYPCFDDHWKLWRLLIKVLRDLAREGGIWEAYGCQ